MPRYLKWDYTNKIVTEYERVGECNGCGDCCRALIGFSTGTLGEDDDIRDLGDGTDGVGVWAEILYDEGTRKHFRVNELVLNHPDHPPCCLLSLGKCTVHDTGHKPGICTVWPVIPEHVIPFKECSYEFRIISERTFE